MMAPGGAEIPARPAVRKRRRKARGAGKGADAVQQYAQGRRDGADEPKKARRIKRDKPEKRAGAGAGSSAPRADRLPQITWSAAPPGARSFWSGHGDSDEGALLKRRKSVRVVKRPAKSLLKDDDVRRWYDNMHRASVNTSISMLRRINLFCDKTNMTPGEFAELAKEDTKKAENILLDFVDWMEGCKYTPGYMECIVKAVRSWMNHNRVDSRIKIRFNNAREARTIANEPNPTPDHIRQMLGMASPRARTVISMMAFSGMRPQVMGNADGSDGLLLGDFPELVLDDGNPRFTTMPAQVVVRSNLSKAGSKYVTFLLRTGCEAVIGYLRERMAAGEVLTPQTPLIRSLQGWEARRRATLRKNPFVRTSTVTGAVVDVVKAILPIRVYSLRGYFDTQLLLAESNGYMSHAYRQFFMGHKGDIEARYTTNKGRMTEQMLIEMRRCYENSQWYLYPDGNDSPKGRKEALFNLWKKQAKLQGIDISDMLGPGGPGDGGSEDAPGPAAPGPAGEQVDAGPPAPPPAPQPAPQPAPVAEPESAGVQDTRTEGIHEVPPTGTPVESECAYVQDTSAERDHGDIPEVPPAAAETADVQDSAIKVAENDDELVAFMSAGWTLHKELDNDKYLVRRPA